MATALDRKAQGMIARNRSIVKQRASGSVARRQTLPEYLEKAEVEALIFCAPHAQARLLMLCQWRSGVRISEALSLEQRDLDLDADSDFACIRIRQGKGRKPRVIPMHDQLRVGLANYLDYTNAKRGPIFSVDRTTAWRWVQQAYDKTVQFNQIPPGRHLGTHTLRHSAARHWLASGVPLNHVSRWMGHASIQTTLIYLELMPDPVGYMERVP